MTEHLILYSLVGHVRAIAAEINRTTIPQYRMRNLDKTFKLVNDELSWLLDEHDKTECARCAKLKENL